jgi:hypothetical protein
MNNHSNYIPRTNLNRRTAIAGSIGVVLTLSAVPLQAQSATPERAPKAAETSTPSPLPTSEEPTILPARSTAATGPSAEVSAGGTAPGELPAAQAPQLAAPSSATTPPPASDANATSADNSADATANAQAEQEASEIAASAETGGPKLNFYGFADFTFAKRLSNNSTDIILPTKSTFYVGNFNLYMSAELGRWRSLSEVRFTYLPDGASTYDAASGKFGRVSTAYTDSTDWNRTQKVGGVIIERVSLEYLAHSLLTIRIGQFLTPYGIWNVDHGSPTVIGVTRPYIVGNEWLPSHQTGLEIYGSLAINATQLGYHLTLSNGRGPIDTYQDLDSNKAVGWRFWVKHDASIGTITLGTSGYKGRYTNNTPTLNVTSSGFAITYPDTERYDELSLAADVKWTWGGYLLQGEAILHDVRYDNRLRPAEAFAASGAAWTPDQRFWGYYALTGYRLKWYGIMPFFMNQYQSWGKGNVLTVWEFSGGLNIRPNEMVVLKVAALGLWRPDPGPAYSKTESQFATQVAWSF